LNTDVNESSFVLLRHGLSEANRDGIVQGQSNYPLSEEGYEQIDALLKFWVTESYSFDRVISSPLQRALDTAERIASAMSLELDIDDVWKERNLGDAQGNHYDQAIEWYSDNPYPSSFESVFGDGESEWELHIRACQAVNKLLQLQTGSYLIVSHGGFLGAVLRAILGIAPSSGRTRPVRFSLANTGFTQLRFVHQEARWCVDAINSTAHL
jgi:broad specificity phosphatase PhoE